MAVQSSVGRMRLVRSEGSPPRYMSPSRSRISLSPLAVNGVLLLLTEMVPDPRGKKRSAWGFHLLFLVWTPQDFDFSNLSPIFALIIWIEGCRYDNRSIHNEVLIFTSKTHLNVHLSECPHDTKHHHWPLFGLPWPWSSLSPCPAGDRGFRPATPLQRNPPVQGHNSSEIQTWWYRGWECMRTAAELIN